MTLEQITRRLVEIKDVLSKEYFVVEIGIFGSYARGEQTPQSDVDILVRFGKPVGLAFVELAEFIERNLGMKVDLVSVGALKPAMRKAIEAEIIHV